MNGSREIPLARRSEAFKLLTSRHGERRLTPTSRLLRVSILTWRSLYNTVVESAANHGWLALMEGDAA
jgi:hypothetical protein